MFINTSGTTYIYSTTATIEQWKEKLTEIYGDELSFYPDPNNADGLECYTKEGYAGCYYQSMGECYIHFIVHFI